MIILGLAGFAWVKALRIDQSIKTFEALVLSICLGIVCAVLSACAVVVARLAFYFVDYAILVLAIASIVAWLVSRPTSLALPERSGLSGYWLPLVLLSFHLLLWVTYLINYPYFPNTEPPDAVFHAEITLSVLRGAFSSPIGATGFAGGAHLLFAFVSSYFGLSVVSAERATAAFVESMSILVAYCLFRRILPSKMAADYASVAFAIIVPAGFVYYSRFGAYPNIVGDFFVLTSLLFAVIIQPKPKVRSVITAVLVEITALISHVSVLVFLLLIVGFSLIACTRFRSQLGGYVVSNLGFFLVPLAGVIILPLLVGRELFYVSGLYLGLHNDLGLVLQVWVHNYLFLAGYLNAVLLFVAFAFVIVKFRSGLWPTFLVSWFGLLILLVFIGTQDSRMVLLSFVPGAGLLGMFLARVQRTVEEFARSRVQRLRVRRAMVMSVMLVLVMVLAAEGPSAYALGHAFVNGESSRQGYIYASMLWLQENTGSNSSVVSAGLPIEYRYLPVIAYRGYVGDFEDNATSIMKLRSSLEFNYVVVSTSFSALNTYYLSGALRSEYENPDVAIFLVLA